MYKTKVCSRCGIKKKLSEFYKDKQKPDGYRSNCKDCCKKWGTQHRQEKIKYNKNYYQLHKKEFKIYNENTKEHRKNIRKIYCLKFPDRVKNSLLKTVYGITLNQYNIMLKLQHGKCAICNKKIDSLLHVDHDHKTGKVRGLLCGSCNRGIGIFKEKIKSLKNAIIYLKRNL